MRIAIDCRSLIARPTSGVGEYTNAITHELAQRDPSLLFFTNVFRRREPPHDIDPARFLSFRWPNLIVNAMTTLFHEPKLTRLLPNVEGFFFPNPAFAALPISIPYVVTIHDLSFVHFPNFFSLKRRLWHAAIRVRQFLEHAVGIIAVSRATAEDCVGTFRIPAERIRVVQSGMTPPAHTDEDVMRVRERYGLWRPYLLSLGTFEPRKNLLTLLEAFSILREQYGYRGDLVLCGAPGWSTSSFTRAIRRHPDKDAIRVLSYVPERDKGGLYAGADIFFYPSVYEGFGFPPLEALACGTPVIAGHHSSLAETLDDMATLVDINNARELAVAAATMRRDVPKKVQEAVLHRYSWKRAGEETFAALQYFFHSHVPAHRY